MRARKCGSPVTAKMEVEPSNLNRRKAQYLDKPKDPLAILRTGLMKLAKPEDGIYKLLGKHWCESDVYYCLVPFVPGTNVSGGGVSAKRQ